MGRGLGKPFFKDGSPDSPVSRKFLVIQIRWHLRQLSFFWRCHMLICSYCHSPFRPRPQVKNPRACSRKACQRARQRDNEEAWRLRHKGRFDSQYHRDQRRRRMKHIQTVITAILECLRIGAAISQATSKIVGMGELVRRFILGLGVRRLNKFWTP